MTIEIFPLSKQLKYVITGFNKLYCAREENALVPTLRIIKFFNNNGPPPSWPASVQSCSPVIRWLKLSCLPPIYLNKSTVIPCEKMERGGTGDYQDHWPGYSAVHFAPTHP